MTLGEGILWSTILILLASGVYVLSVRRKWKIFGKIIGSLALVSVLIGVATWGYIKYEARPKIVTELDEIRFGMTPIEIRLLKGEPTKAGTIEEKDKSSHVGLRMSWTYTDSYAGDLGVLFYGDHPDMMKVAIVCKRGGYGELLGVGKYTSEKTMKNKLGEPTDVSIHKDGLSKFVSYRQWKVAYEITRGTVTQLCISDSGTVRYADEYDGTLGEINKPP